MTNLYKMLHNLSEYRGLFDIKNPRKLIVMWSVVYFNSYLINFLKTTKFVKDKRNINLQVILELQLKIHKYKN